ncbi:hypothetical protein BJ138DRAFT_1159466 [Hygrophoropsis aurantiaca]|uniref:Uncharacterized protein n=1 Tax=Hygrophoropsis aurantiaca TaxID=72124 RepID=A0ACB8A3R8_9AGAM|nr:hypothetical protein BJ138DRAFT_1159466 [Hygrophoropsis aurantiaca]
MINHRTLRVYNSLWILLSTLWIPDSRFFLRSTHPPHTKDEDAATPRTRTQPHRGRRRSASQSQPKHRRRRGQYYHSPRQYYHSPRQYDHSPRQYHHSPRQYHHSPRQYHHSPRQYDHSPSIDEVHRDIAGHAFMTTSRTTPSPQGPDT